MSVIIFDSWTINSIRSIYVCFTLWLMDWNGSFPFFGGMVYTYIHSETSHYVAVRLNDTKGMAGHILAPKAQMIEDLVAGIQIHFLEPDRSCVWQVTLTIKVIKSNNTSSSSNNNNNNDDGKRTSHLPWYHHHRHWPFGIWRTKGVGSMLIISNYSSNWMIQFYLQLWCSFFHRLCLELPLLQEGTARRA